MKLRALFAAGLMSVGVASVSCSTQSPITDGGDGVDAEIIEGGIVTEAGVCGPLTAVAAPGDMPPPEIRTNSCTAAQVGDYALCQTTKPSLCSEFLAKQPGEACAKCIESQSDQAQWGVLVFTTSQQARFNYGGCVDLALGQVGQSSSCGQRIFQSYTCQEEACILCEGQKTQSSDGGSTNAFGPCSALSIEPGGPCATYDAMVQDPGGPCAALADAAPPDVANCFPDTAITDAVQQRIDFLTRIVTYFCGAPP